MTGNKTVREKKTRSLRIMNMHIPYHIVMILWSFISIFPLFFLVINTFKVKKEIYINFFGMPQKWTLENYTSLMSNSDFFGYFRNSFLVVVVSLSMILLVGSLCAYALAHWRTKTSKVVYYFFVIGMMLPIKIATIRLLQIMKALNTLNTLFCLFPVYIAMGLPTAIFILTEFIHGLPRELYEAGYMDGASRFAGGSVPARESGLLNGGGIYDFYQTADGGYMSVGALEPKFWAALSDGVGHPEWRDGKILRTDTLGVKTELTRIFRTNPRAEWTEVVDGLDVCVEPIMDLDEVARDEHQRSR
jgi:ABC-type sulfate transport system permease component